MVWQMLAAQVAGSVIQGAMQDGQNYKAAKAQFKEVRRQNRLREHEASVQQLQIEHEKSLLRQQVTKSLDLAQREAQRQAGGVNAAAAAAGVKGSTVDAVAQTVAQDLQERQYELQHQAEQGLQDLNAQIRQGWHYAQHGGQQPQRYESQIGQYLAQGVVNAATTYANQYFKFGSGADNKSTGGR